MRLAKALTSGLDIRAEVPWIGSRNCSAWQQRRAQKQRYTHSGSWQLTQGDSNDRSYCHRDPHSTHSQCCKGGRRGRLGHMGGVTEGQARKDGRTAGYCFEL